MQQMRHQHAILIAAVLTSATTGLVHHDILLVIRLSRLFENLRDLGLERDLLLHCFGLSRAHHSLKVDHGGCHRRRVLPLPGSDRHGLGEEDLLVRVIVWIQLEGGHIWQKILIQGARLQASKGSFWSRDI